MSEKNRIVAQQAELSAPRIPLPADGLGKLMRGMLFAQGFRLDR